MSESDKSERFVNSSWRHSSQYLVSCCRRCVRTGLISPLEGQPVRCEHHRPAVLYDAHDGIPKEAAGVRVHPCGGFILNKQERTQEKFTRLQMNTDQNPYLRQHMAKISNLCQFKSNCALCQPMCETFKARLDCTHMASHLDPYTISMMNPCIKPPNPKQPCAAAGLQRFPFGNLAHASCKAPM